MAQRRLQLSLLLLRLGVFVVFLFWTIDKFVRPAHAAGVFANFYHLPGVGEAVLYGIAAAELLLLLAFVAGVKPAWTYGAIAVLHAISTLSSYKQYLHPFEGPNLLFFAAWPMLAGCVALWLLREHDTLWTIHGVLSKQRR